MPDNAYDELLEKYTNLHASFEAANQSVYDLQRQIKTAKANEVEYQEEIKSLQSLGTAEKQKLETKVQQLEEGNLMLKTSHSESVNHLEKELSEKDEEIQNLKKQLDEIIKICETQESPMNETLLDELNEWKQQNSVLNEKVSELEDLLRLTEKRNSDLEESLKRSEEELEEYRESLKCKRDEIEEANVLIQNLKDELLCAQSELDSLRSRPLDAKSQGNSLFAEVDDRRLKLQENLKSMKTKYMEMQRDRASLLKKITRLHNENTELVEQWEAEIEGKKSDDETILYSYKNQIEVLNKLVESYKKQLEEKYNLSDSASSAAKFFEGMLAMKNGEVEKLRRDMSLRATNYTTVSYDLAEANRNLRKHKVQIAQLKSEIGRLQMKLEETQMQSPIEKENKTPHEENHILNPAIKNIKTEFCNTDLKNYETGKKVQFTEVEEESAHGEHNPNVTTRRGAKVMVLKATKY